MRLGHTWLELGRSLQVHEAELEGFDRDNRRLREKAFEMLMRWKQSEGTAATYSVLCKALCDTYVNRQDLAKKFVFFPSVSRWRLSQKVHGKQLRLAVPLRFASVAAVYVSR